MSRMQDETNLSTTEVFAGVDVSKRHLDVFLHPSRRRKRYANTKTGIRAMVRLFHSEKVQLVALEATGRYHRHLHRVLHEAGIATSVVNPFRSRKFADALGQIAKTDAIDAEVLAHFAAFLRPEATEPQSGSQIDLRDLTLARRQLLAEIGTLKRQLSETEHALIARQIRARIAMCERHRSALETEIHIIIQAHTDLSRKFEILMSIPGIGPVAAITLLSELEELGHANCKEIAALVGLAPMNRDSGQRKGHRMIRGGRQVIRNVLYMCAVAISHRDNSMARFYSHLVSKGKNPKMALTALMRKLLVLANTLVAQNRLWQPEAPAN